jgi:ribosomal protein L29
MVEEEIRKHLEKDMEEFYKMIEEDKDFLAKLKMKKVV